MARNSRTAAAAGEREAVGYVRVSTQGQAVEGVSLAAQRSAIEAHCRAAGLRLVAILADEGASGKRADNRPGLQAAVEMASERGAVLVVYSLSRLARSVRDTLSIAESIEAAGADLASLSERIDTSGACGRMVFRMLAVLAEFEREQIAERTRDALRHKRAAGFKLGGHAPYGFSVERVEGQRPRLVPNPTEQAVLLRVRELHDDGATLRGIAAQLESEGIRPRSGKGWHPKVLRGMMASASLQGG